jgi:hypothetical protein
VIRRIVCLIVILAVLVGVGLATQAALAAPRAPLG